MKMTKRLQTLGAVLALIGLGFLVGAGIAYAKVQDGYDSLQSVSYTHLTLPTNREV